MKNLIAARPGSYRKFSDLAFEYLPRAGIHHVEIAPPAPSEARETLSMLAEKGLTPSSLATGCDLSKPQSISDLARDLGVAGAIGVQVVFCSTNTGGLAGEEPYLRLRELGDTAQENAAVLSMETHPNLCQNSEQMLETMRRVDHPHVRINFDTANIYYYSPEYREHLDVTELERVAEYVASVHLKDTNGQPRTWYFPALGEGVVDYPSVFRILNDVGFHGPFTMEMEGIEGEDLSLEETHQRILDSMAHLRAIGAV